MAFAPPKQDSVHFFEENYGLRDLSSELASSGDYGQQAIMPTITTTTEQRSFDADKLSRVADTFNTVVTACAQQNESVHHIPPLNCSVHLTTEEYFVSSVAAEKFSLLEDLAEGSIVTHGAGGDHPGEQRTRPDDGPPRTTDNAPQFCQSYQPDDEGAMQDDASNTASNRVLNHLDNILRNQVNFELDQFSSSIHDILDKQLVHIHHVLRLSESSPNMKEFDCRTETDAGQGDFEDSLHGGPNAVEEAAKMKCIVELFVSASIITNVLAHKKFTV